MYFQQFYLSCLAHASYMVGSEGEAAVVDPQRDVEIYLQEAQRQGLKITYVIETHMHADFVSGHRELAARTGAQICVGARAGAQFPHIAVRDGDELRIGKCLLRFLETPGHSIDSICAVLYDLEGKDAPGDPWGVFTGDTLFIGEVGRPDLSPHYTPHQLAGMLYDSLQQKLLTLPDSCRIYPAHGAGSLCGRNISSGTQSTIGHERALNYALRPRTREEFVELLTSEFPDRPEYFLRDAQLNRVGAAMINELPELVPLAPEEVLRKQSSGCVVLDTRTPAQFGAGHVPGSIHIGLCGQYASWAGTLIGLDTPIILVVAGPAELQEAQVRLARVGIERIIGFLGGPGSEGPEASAQAIVAWQSVGLPLNEVPQISVLDLYEQLCDQPNEIQVVDVRRPVEWEAGHIAQARLMPLNRLRTLVHDLDTQRPIAVHCKSGYRSSIGASLLLRAGFKQVMNVVGGFEAWQTQKLPVAAEKAAAQAAG